MIADPPADVRPHGELAGRRGGVRMVARVFRQTFGWRLFTLGAWAFLGLILASSIFANVLAPMNPLAQRLDDRLLPPVWVAGGKTPYILGTDQLGRDILSRIMYGGRITLLIAVAAVVASGTLGTALGVTSGYFGGRVDDLVMRIADAQLAMPFILLAIAVIGILGPSLLNLIAVLSLTGWVVFARIARSQVLVIRERGFVEAAKAIGASDWRLLRVHILPNVLPTIAVVSSLELGTMIFGEAALSFLGLGVPPPAATWGTMLGDGRSYLLVSWWLSTFPGLALALTVLSINIVGDWIRDQLDVQLRSRE